VAYVVAWRALTPRGRGWTIGATACGLALRCLVAPHLLAMIFIGYKQTEHALTLLPLSHYGVGATALYHTAFGFLSAPDHEAIMAVNAVIGGLTLPLIGALAARLLADQRAGVIAAWLVALTPLFIRNDASEANIVPTLWWLTGGLVLLDAWFETGRRAALGASLPLLALAAMARPEMPVLMAALLPLTALARGWAWSDIRRPLTILAAVALAALVLPHVLHTLNAMQVLEGRSSLPGLGELSALPTLIVDRNIVLRPALFPLGISLCALGGFAAAFRGGVPRGRVFSGCVAAMAFASLALYVVDLDEANIARVQVPGALFVTILGALGLARLWSVGPRPGVLTGLVMCAALASAAPTAQSLWAPANEHTEERLIQEAAAALPDAAPFTLVRLGESDRRAQKGDSRFTHLHFPDYLFRPPQREGLLRAARDFFDDPAIGPDTFFFHGLRCYAEFRSQGVPAPEGEDLHPACARMHRDFTLEPVFERRVTNHGDVWIRYYGTAEELPVGLYRVRGPR